MFCKIDQTLGMCIYSLFSGFFYCFCFLLVFVVVVVVLFFGCTSRPSQNPLILVHPPVCVSKTNISMPIHFSSVISYPAGHVDSITELGKLD